MNMTKTQANKKYNKNKLMNYIKNVCRIKSHADTLKYNTKKKRIKQNNRKTKSVHICAK